MKKLILILTILATGYSADCQTNALSDNVGYATPNKDTLYIIQDMYNIIQSVWSYDEFTEKKPIIIAVESVDRFYARKED